VNGRLVASLVWIAVVLVRPLRETVASMATILWPSAKLDEDLLHTPVRLMFIVACFTIGYVLTAWLAGKLIAWTRAQSGREDEFLRPHGGDALTPAAILLTLVWLSSCLALRCLTLPLIGAALLVLAGMTGARETPVVPAPQPRPLPQPPAPLPDPDPDGGQHPDDAEDESFFYRVYSWLFNEEPFRKSGREHSLCSRLRLERATYEHFKAQPHTVEADADFVKFANAELDDQVVTTAAARLRAIVVEHGLEQLTEIHLTMAFTLSLRFADDQAEYGHEYPKFPVESLVDKRGDCEDHAILCGAILHRLGHRVALVLMSTGPETGHAGLAVEAPEHIEGVSFHVPQLGADMFYCEVTPAELTTETTTAVQWWLGMEPPNDASGFRVFPIEGVAS